MEKKLEVVHLLTNPPQPAESRALVTEVLGKLQVTGAALDTIRGAANSTRWIIDVVSDGSEILFQLLDHRSGRPVNPDIISLTLAPRSASFHDAKPFISAINGGAFTVSHACPCAYRIAVDALHTATR